MPQLLPRVSSSESAVSSGTTASTASRESTTSSETSDAGASMSKWKLKKEERKLVRLQERRIRNQGVRRILR
eukprot:CAMPEP_0198356282 /NCGR_PEP_ID=MMETSP1450-20131203/122254_1 /TAXON_ID=753684 ORGANISM="Madagascaria erythrocladiodes, Strain CCMP3234" /NCGR_SAMPLE_ID=MMETSP1450 /ASSEMBLY_ACC=CAM_ASM_001115 /LENGTH=71 /DNA_ID=CAMNT_0044062757 /DNA_START=144 /DNA_END=359 /DNA_ORIENTATION=-